MFERYTEKARRVIFFARYEASQLGCPCIETEHLLLGLLREDHALTRRFLGSPGAAEAIRIEIEQHTIFRDKVSTSVDLPLSDEGKRALSYSAEEADRLSQKYIGTEHLLLGLLREEKCFAAKLLRDRKIDLDQVREELGRFSHDLISREGPKQLTLITQFCRDFIPAVCQVQPLVGRENELERLIYILCRFNKSNPVLVGEAGVGKKTIVGGLVQRITDGAIPAALAGKSVLSLDLSLVAATQQDRTWPEKFQKALATEGVIFFVDELHTPALSGDALIRIAETLKPLLMRGKIQCISTATATGYARAIENHRWLEQRFQALEVVPAGETDAINVLLGIKAEYEKFHGVSYTEDALSHAVYYANCCIRGGALPGKAVDVIDEAGASAGRHHIEPREEIVELQMRIKFIVQRMEGAVANHELEKARFYSDEERKERNHLRQLREKYKLNETSPVPVTREHIENVVSRWTGASVDSIRKILANSKQPHP